MRTTCATVASLVLAGTTFAGTINVPADYPTIQGAVDAASDGTEIIVAPGTYTSTQDGHVVDMKGKAVTLRASGTPEETIIDGQDTRRGIACATGETDATVIEGFTITNGVGVWYDYNGNGSANGGGILCYASSPTITNCRITNGRATEWLAGGGGIGCQGGSSPTITDCTISGNISEAGGGISSHQSSPTITNCTIHGNTTTRMYGTGGGIRFEQGGSPTITGCEISGNTSHIDGGGIHCKSSSPVITSCTITGNTFVEYGGGIFCEQSSPNITDCTITGNWTAESWAEGAGIACDGNSHPTITGCEITGNTAGYSGGGIYHSSGSSNSILTDTIVCGNAPDQIHGNWTDDGGNCDADSCVDDDDNGIPDQCENCLGDATADGHIDVNDLLYVLSAWDTAEPNADFDDNGVVNVDDILILLGNFGDTCP